MIKKVTMFGFPKSGNSLLHKILMTIYMHTKNGYVSKLDCKPEKLLFKDYYRVDDVTLHNGDFISSKVFSKFIKCDVDDLRNNSSIIWTHDLISQRHIDSLVGSARRAIYLKKNPRDVIESMIYHSIRMVPFNKEYTITCPRELAQREDIILKWCGALKRHIDSSKHVDGMLILNFEELIGSSKYDSILRIMKFIGLNDHDKSLADLIIKDTDINVMKKESPNHIGIKRNPLKFSRRLEKEIDEIGRY